MALHLSEIDVSLLADHRGAESDVRIRQALAQARFLLRVSRTVTALQHPQRALEALTGLLVEDLVEFCQVSVRTATTVLTCARTSGGAPAYTSGPPDPESWSRLAGTLDTAAPQIVLPLVARGRLIGRLVLGREHPRTFAGCANFLDDLADGVAADLDTLLEVWESRRMVALLRGSLFPVSAREVPHFRIATYFREAHQRERLSGDFVEVFGPDDDLEVVCGDVEGKGVGAAVEARHIRTTVRVAALVDRDPAFVLGLANRALFSRTDEQQTRLATAICARIRSEDGSCRVTVANAGHPPALLVRSDGQVEELQPEGPTLGIAAQATYGSATAAIAPGDTLLLHTDGVTEARGVHDLFGEDRLRQLLERLGSVPAQGQVEALAVAVSEHVGDRPQDDIAMIAVQRRATAS